MKVGGLSAQEVETLLASRLRKFLRSPKVTVFISEYRSQQIAVMGSVQNPGILNIQKPKTILELVTMSGGLSEHAGINLYVQTTIRNPETGKIFLGLCV